MFVLLYVFSFRACSFTFFLFRTDSIDSNQFAGVKSSRFARRQMSSTTPSSSSKPKLGFKMTVPTRDNKSTQPTTATLTFIKQRCPCETSSVGVAVTRRGFRSRGCTSNSNLGIKNDAPHKTSHRKPRTRGRVTTRGRIAARASANK